MGVRVSIVCLALAAVAAAQSLPSSMPVPPAAEPWTPPEEPVPGLSLAIALPHDALYVGDPLTVTAFVSSPRLRQEAMRRLAEAPPPEAASAPAAALTLSADPGPRLAVPSDWPRSVRFEVLRLEAGAAPEPVMAEFDWPAALAAAPRSRGAGPAGRAHYARWDLPPGTLELKPGTYLLTATWDPHEAVDAAWIDGPEPLRAEVRFTVAEPADPFARAAHAERLARWHYARGECEQALAWGQQALRPMPAQANANYLSLSMLVADCQARAGQFPQAQRTLRDVQRRLPPGREDLGRMVEELLSEVSRRAEAPAPRP